MLLHAGSRNAHRFLNWLAPLFVAVIGGLTPLVHAAGVDQIERSPSRIGSGADQRQWNLEKAGNILANGGFENGTSGWAQTVSTPGYTVITLDAAQARTGSGFAFLGGLHSNVDTLYQDFIVPAGVQSVTLTFWYRISTEETSTTTAFDTMNVSIRNPSNGAILQSVVTMSNLWATSGWAQSPSLDLTPFKGQTIRLFFSSTTDSTLLTAFKVDDIAVNTTDPVPTTPQLINISTRGQVLTGNDVMIGGFVIGGTAARTVLIRARGPSMIPAGVTNALANPQLTLVNQATNLVIATNDNWGSASNAASILATGLAPTNAFESAILMTLSPGAYTAIVSGVGGSTGVGIVEVFAQ